MIVFLEIALKNCMNFSLASVFNKILESLIYWILCLLIRIFYIDRPFD